MEQQSQTSTNRVYRHRALKRAGLARFTVELDWELLADRLIISGDLDPFDRADQAKVMVI